MPQAVQRIRIYTPFLATVAVVMIVGSMIASNVAVVSASGFTIVTAVLTLHSCGFAIGYFLSKALGLSDKIARTNSIEVLQGAGGGGERGVRGGGGGGEACARAGGGGRGQVYMGEGQVPCLLAPARQGGTQGTAACCYDSKALCTP